MPIRMHLQSRRNRLDRQLTSPLGCLQRGGYAHLVPGEFLKNTTPGHSYRAPYVMATYVFLGEKPSIGGSRTK